MKFDCGFGEIVCVLVYVSLCVGRGGGGCSYTAAALLHGHILVLRYSLKVQPIIQK